MGSLTAGKSYRYETIDGKTYSIEEGSGRRILIGYNLPKRRDPLQYDILETQMWQDIVAAGKTNKSLQKVLNRAILIYQTIKDNNE